MLRYLLLRLLRLVLSGWLIVSGVFLLSRTLPDDIVLLQFASGGLQGVAVSAAEQRQAEQRLRHRLGLDLPLFYFSPPTIATGWRWQWYGSYNQYHVWAKKLVRGDLGESYRDGEPVTALLAAALVYTLPLTTSAALLATILAVFLAVRMASRPAYKNRMLQGLYALDSLPLFVLGLLLLFLLANPDMLPLFPAYGLGQEAAAADNWLMRTITVGYHLVLPLTCLVLVNLPRLIVQLDASLEHELRTNYAATARAKGATAARVVQRHALRNALLPLIALLTDLLPALVAGAVIVEVIFALPGVGRLLASAAASRDYPVLLGGVLLTAFVRLLAQLLADWLYFRADPRIRLQHE